jgi:hypothetical protein
MRANSSISSLVVVVLALTSGCSPAEDAPLVATPPPAPEPAPTPPQAPVDELLREVEPDRRAAQAQQPLNEIRERGLEPGDRSAGPTEPAVPPRVLDRLIYQCTDEITFAVRIVGSSLYAFPPKHSNGYIVLERVAADEGVHYASRGADFRAKDDLATLRVNDDLYVDCVSSPAAAIWLDLPRSGVR